MLLFLTLAIADFFLVLETTLTSVALTPSAIDNSIGTVKDSLDSRLVVKEYGENDLEDILVTEKKELLSSSKDSTGGDGSDGAG